MKQWLDKWKHIKKDQILILLLAGVLLLVISIPTKQDDSLLPSAQENTETEEKIVPALSKTQQLELKLQTILGHVEGIGKTEVMLTLKSDGKRIVEKDMEETSKNQKDSEGNGSLIEESAGESTVLQRDGSGNEIPYVSEALEPEIAGVLVIAQGAENPQTVSEITEAVMALFGVEAHKIKVMKMES